MAGTLIAQAIMKKALEYQLSPKLIAAVIYQESRGNPWAFRYEPGFYDKYIKTRRLADFKGLMPSKKQVTIYTELTCRASSFGLMQILGSTAREHGFRGIYLSELFDIETNIDFGCRVLSKLFAEGLDIEKVLLRYNGGGNAEYPTQVQKWMDEGQIEFLLA